MGNQPTDVAGRPLSGNAEALNSGSACLRDSVGTIARYAVPSMVVFTLIYALFAGLRTAGEPDLGWQLATGRWIVQHRSIPFSEVFSYTAFGQEWIYPVLSQLLFYGAYVLGGYKLLSCIGATACVATVATLMRRGQAPAVVLAWIAIPILADRTVVRAELFTEVLFAVFVSILWHYHRSGRGPLWALPVLMLLWANLHPGFSAGLAMCAAYVFLEVSEGAFGEWREPLKRLRRAGPWLAAAVVATAVNPWGLRLYAAISRQHDAYQLHSRWIREWIPMRFTVAALGNAFAWGEAKSSVLWLMAASAVAVVMALWTRRFAAAVILGFAAFLAGHAIRFQAPFATIAVIVGGSVIADAVAEITWTRRLWSRVGRWAAPACVLTIAVLSGVRTWEIATNRFYLRTPHDSYFGVGESPVFPEQAAAFLLREHLPANVFNDTNSGGFMVWALSPAYTHYIDTRNVPFGTETFMKHHALLSKPLDSELWLREAEGRNINTIFVSVDRMIGAGPLSMLDQSCRSQRWRPVYLDTQAAIFVRVSPETQALISRLQLDCNSVRFDHPPAAAGVQGRAVQFHYYLNAASILIQLGRYQEALDAAQHADHLFQNIPSLHYVRGVLLYNMGRTDEGEQDLRKAAALGDLEAFSSLASIYMQQHRYGEQVAALEHVSDVNVLPYAADLQLGYAHLAMGSPEKALNAFENAAKESPYVGDAYSYGGEFREAIAQGTALARRQLQGK